MHDFASFGSNAGEAGPWDASVLELLPAAVYVCDADGAITRFNRRAEELWGRTPALGASGDRFCGSYRLFGLDGDPLPHDCTPMAESLRTGRSFRNVEVLLQQPSGRQLWVQVNIDPIRAGDGAILGAINCFQDITEQKERERQLRQNRSLFETIIDTTPECVKVVARDGSLRLVNQAGLNALEADAFEQVAGADVFAMIASEHREEWRANHERICAGERISWEFDMLSLRGSRRHMETHAAPLEWIDDTVAHLAITRDVTQRKRDEDALRASELRWRTLLKGLPGAVYVTDAEGYLTFYNEACVELAGREPELGSDRWCISWKLLQPDGRELPHDECLMAVALKDARSLRGEEAVIERPDGTHVPVLAYPTPIFNQDGELTGAINMVIDITERKREEERRKLLLNELNHRVKNTLATVQAIAAQTLRNTGGDAPRRFEHRLIALARAHNVLTEENWEGADFAEIVQKSISHAGQSRIDARGPRLWLPPKVALSLAMALHELCTNAAKYGALSVETGGILIEWEHAKLDGLPGLAVRWRERGGPPVTPPRHTGFGTRMLQRALVLDLGARVDLQFSEGGLTFDLEVPLAC